MYSEDHWPTTGSCFSEFALDVMLDGKKKKEKILFHLNDFSVICSPNKLSNFHFIKKDPLNVVSAAQHPIWSWYIFIIFFAKAAWENETHFMANYNKNIFASKLIRVPDFQLFQWN